jgi:hypothetical protein
MRLARSSGALLCAAALVAAPGCHSSSPTAPTGVVTAVLVLSVNPNPLKGTITNTLGPVYTTQWTLKIQETAGLGGLVQQVKASIYDDTTGILVSTTLFDDKDLIVFVGTNRIEPKGSMEVPQQMSYTLSANQTAATLTLDVQFKDDKGIAHEPSFLVKIS